MGKRLTDDAARDEVLELRRIMCSTLDFDRLQRVIHCASHLLFRVPERWVDSVHGVIVEAEHRSRYAVVRKEAPDA